jgi:hypothetical protein
MNFFSQNLKLAICSSLTHREKIIIDNTTFSFLVILSLVSDIVPSGDFLQRILNTLNVLIENKLIRRRHLMIEEDPY